MSEYQYHEFRTIDRPLIGGEMDERTTERVRHTHAGWSKRASGTIRKNKND
jgi:hypothetical protein